MTKRSRLAVAASVLVFAWLAARPAAARDKEIQQLAADIRMLQEQSQLLQNLLGQLGDALKVVNQRIDDQSRVAVKAFADQKLIIDTVSKDLSVVREKLDDTNTRVGSVSQEVDALRQGLQQQAAAAAAAARQSTPGESTDAGTPGAPAAVPPPSSPTPIVIGVSPQRMFDTAKGDYAAGLWDLAVTGFRGYITSFPKSDMADDAQVYIGNSYLQDGKNDRAIEAYDLAIRTYPNGNAIPEAYYKKGLAHRNLRQIEQARQAFDTVVRLFPQSDAAGLARQALMQLGGPPAR